MPESMMPTNKFEDESARSSQEKRPEMEGPVESKVVLDFMRHGKREKHPNKFLDGGPELPLTPEGRKQGDERGEELDPQTEVSLGWGSPKFRSGETAYRAMLANEDIDPDDTYEDIEAKVDEELKGVGKKMIVDSRLDFHDGGPIATGAKEAYHEGRYMSWVINDSDKDAIEMNDTESTTLTRMAGNVAEIVQRYTKVGNNFNRLASKTDKYEESGNQLERYLGTHQGISESFAAKVLEKIKGDDAKNEFVTSVGGGFDETEGVHIEIANKGTEQKIVMTYLLKDESGDREESVEFGAEVLQEIIDDREAFEKQVRA